MWERRKDFDDALTSEPAIQGYTTLFFLLGNLYPYCGKGPEIQSTSFHTAQTLHIHQHLHLYDISVVYSLILTQKNFIRNL